MRKVYVVVSEGITGKVINGVCSSQRKAEVLARIAGESFDNVKIQPEELF